MDFKTVTTKENTITTATKDDAADLTENDDAIDTSNTKNEETIHEELHLYISSYIWSPGVPDILSCGTEYLCMGYRIS